MTKYFFHVLKCILFLFFLSNGFAFDLDDFFNKTSRAEIIIHQQNLKIKNVIFIPFKASEKEIGESVSYQFHTMCLKTNFYKAPGQAQFNQMILKENLKSWNIPVTEALKIAQQVDSEGLIFGYVEEYTLTASDNNPLPYISLRAELLDSKTGTKIWTIIHNAYDHSKDVDLHLLSQKIIFDMISTLHFYFVKTTESLRSNSVELIKKNPEIILPETPRNFQLSSNLLRKVEISWSIPFDKPSKYIIERALNSAGPFLEIAKISPSKTKYIDQNSKKNLLEDNKTYYYRMFAISSKGQRSPPTAMKKSVTAKPPVPPLNVTAKPNKSRGIFLTWEVPESEGVISYIIQRKIANQPDTFKAIKTVTNKTFFQDGGSTKSTLIDANEYIYRIISVNKVGASGPPSNPVLVKTLPPPSLVKGILAMSNEVRCILLSWIPNLETDIVKYIIYRSETSEGPFSEIASIKASQKTSFLDGKKNPGNLPDNFTYYYRVFAINDVGAKSRESEIVNATTRSIPPVVSRFSAQSGEARQVTLSWECSTDETVRGYIIFRAFHDLKFDKIFTLKGRDQSSYLDQGKHFRRKKNIGILLDSMQYRYKIIAYNTAKAESPSSHIAIASTKSLPPPPQEIQIFKRDEQSFLITWKSSTPFDSEEFLLEVSKNQKKFRPLGQVKAKDGEVNYSYIHSDISSKINYSYRIKIMTKNSLEGIWSEPASFKLKKQSIPSNYES